VINPVFFAGELVELSDKDQTMDEAFDQEPVPPPAPVHAVFTIEQVRPHFDVVMAEELPVPPVTAFRQAQEDRCYNLRLLNECRHTEGQINSKQANDNVVADMLADDPGFLDEQRALYHTIRRAREGLSVILRLVALAVVPPSRVVNMVNKRGESRDDCTWRGGQ
jgi:hypothetical protein